MVFLIDIAANDSGFLLDPDKSHVKAGIHLSFYNILCDFFFAGSLIPRKSNNPRGSFTRISTYTKLDKINHRPMARQKVNHRIFVVVI